MNLGAKAVALKCHCQSARERHLSAALVPVTPLAIDQIIPMAREQI
jgi:hypothetical protein